MQSVVPTVVLPTPPKQTTVKQAVPAVPGQVRGVKTNADTIENKLQRRKMPEWAKGVALKSALQRQHKMEVRYVRVLRECEE